MAVSLRFHQTHEYAFPVTSAHPFVEPASSTALACVLHSGDPYLAFLTQTTYADEFIYLHLGFDQIMARVPTPPGRETTSGMGYDHARRRLICGAATTDSATVYVIDPVTGAEIAARDLSVDTVWPANSAFSTQGTATNGFLFAQTGQSDSQATGTGAVEPISTIQVRSYDGTLVSDRSYDNRAFTGICKTPLSWTLTDKERHEIVILGPLGNELIAAPGVGTAGGMQAIAYDDVRPQQSVAQLSEPPGAIGPVGTLYHPDTDWDPKPWLGRHRLYIANVPDQIIYAGYLTTD